MTASSTRPDGRVNHKVFEMHFRKSSDTSTCVPVVRLLRSRPVPNRVATDRETEPISTYLFAFAAGPFQKVHHAEGLPDVYVRKSQVARAYEETPQIQQMTALGMIYLARYFWLDGSGRSDCARTNAQHLNSVSSKPPLPPSQPDSEFTDHSDVEIGDQGLP
jgi:hypothetical protein